VITGNTVQISPPFIVDAEDLHRIAAVLREGLDSL
jgi:adenosylmethionine-8-amino-7-oxononanoate aminotransferase